MVGDFSEMQEKSSPRAKEGLNFASLLDEGLFGNQFAAAKSQIRLADGGGSPGTYEDDPENPRRPRDDDDEPRRPHEDDDDPPFLMPKKHKLDGGGSPGTYEPDDEPRRPGGDDEDPDMPRRPDSEEEYPPFVRPKS